MKLKASAKGRRVGILGHFSLNNWPFGITSFPQDFHVKPEDWRLQRNSSNVDLFES
jgi:hypothetical protein